VSVIHGKGVPLFEVFGQGGQGEGVLPIAWASSIYAQAVLTCFHNGMKIKKRI
jgi:hypothetical protein